MRRDLLGGVLLGEPETHLIPHIACDAARVSRALRSRLGKTLGLIGSVAASARAALELSTDRCR